MTRPDAPEDPDFEHPFVLSEGVGSCGEGDQATLASLSRQLAELKTLFLEGQTKIMSEQDDLNKAVADLTAAVGQNTAEVSAAAGEIGNLTAALKASSGDPAAVEAAATAIEAQVTAINASNAALTAAAPPATPAAPAAITIGPESFVATANSTLNDVIQGAGGTGNITFSGAPENGLTITNGGNSTGVIGGTAPAAGASASIDVTYADEASPPQTGTATITVTGQ